MSLMDVLRGMANGPRGPAEPGRRGGISPITMGLLALLAYKTMRWLRRRECRATSCCSASLPSCRRTLTNSRRRDAFPRRTKHRSELSVLAFAATRRCEPRNRFKSNWLRPSFR